MELDLSTVTPQPSKFREHEEEVVEDSIDQVMELIRLAKVPEAVLARRAVKQLTELLQIQEKGWVN